MAIPTDFQGVLWSRDVSSLDLQEDKNYIIHQVLMYGSLDQINWLKSVYRIGEMKEVFLGHPRRIYTPQAFNFVKNYLLGIKAELSEEKYARATF